MFIQGGGRDENDMVLYVSIGDALYSWQSSLHISCNASTARLGHRLDAKNFAKIFRFSVTSNF
jgi:hypothetical protein